MNNGLTAIYVRVSTQEQAAEGYSVGEQTERASKYCQAMSWSVYKVYTDAGFSGANTNRPALKQLIKDVETGKLNRVLVYKLDRLSRSQKDTLMLIEDTFLANGVDFVSMSENFDTSSPFGRAMVGILAVFAQLEREQIKERMIMGKQARANLGMYSAGRAPIGYDYIPRTKTEPARLIVNEFEKLQIQKVFSDYAAGLPVSQTANELNKSGMTHKYGLWLPSTIRSVISRKTYIGYVQFNGIWHKADHTPLVSETLFYNCQRVHEKHVADHKSYNRRPGKATTYFGGLLVCAQCGHKYVKATAYAKGKKYEYYRCASHSHAQKRLQLNTICKNKEWRKAELDAMLIDEIKKLKLEPYKCVADTDTTPNKAQTLKSELSRIDNQISRLIDLYSLGTISPEVLQAHVDKLNAQKLSLEQEIEKTELTNQGKLSHDTVREYVTSFADIIDTGDFDSIRAIITALIEKIELNDNDITIYWNFV